MLLCGRHRSQIDEHAVFGDARDDRGRLLDEAGWTDRDGDGDRENREGTPLVISIK